ncbi:MAG: hypothetical protein ACLFP4_08345 [Spirochaetales bacterium]
MDIEWAASGATSGVLKVRVSPPSPALCHTVVTPDGPIRWSLQNDTLFVDADRGLPANARGTEEAVRYVMKSSGLAKRFSIFRVMAEAAESAQTPREAVLSA